MDGGPPRTAQQLPPRTPVPPPLLGSWSGGSGNDSTGGKKYRFGSDGTVVRTERGAEQSGTVVVNGSTLTFHFDAVTWTVTWSVTACMDPTGDGFPYRLLFLDALSYAQGC
jgi:hypothetical protein